MDFQHRPGGKTGVGGVASASDANRDRRERLRQLALETIDLNKVKQTFIIDYNYDLENFCWLLFIYVFIYLLYVTYTRKNIRHKKN